MKGVARFWRCLLCSLCLKSRTFNSERSVVKTLLNGVCEMKWLSVFAVALAALLCFVPSVSLAQCANGVCQRPQMVSPVVIAQPEQVFYGSIQYSPLPVYESPPASCCGSRCGHGATCNSRQAIQFACGSGYCSPKPNPDPISYYSTGQQSRASSVGISLNWNRCANGRCSTSWR